MDDAELNEKPVLEPPINPANYTHIIGVFRTQEQANAAVEALKQAEFADDCILVTDYHTEQATDTRYVVHVMAPERDHEAVGILTHHGANNSDLPPGTEIVNGDLTSSEHQEKDVRPVPEPDRLNPDAFPVPNEIDEVR
jgi:rhodanese-related sulfurtransferase